MNIEFEWDARKARANIKKHGVAFDEALTVFADPPARIFDDPDHSAEEPREIIVGYSGRPRLLIVGVHGTLWAGSTHSCTARDKSRTETP